jgi:L-alanine-DL-glutamate epimerase-like enolase superfamily enzyme
VARQPPEALLMAVAAVLVQQFRSAPAEVPQPPEAPVMAVRVRQPPVAPGAALVLALQFRSALDRGAAAVARRRPAALALGSATVLAA